MLFLQDLGELGEAIKLYQAVIHIDPSQAIAFFNLAMIYKAQGNLLEAIKGYQEAITLQPDYAEAYQNLAVTSFKAGLIQESVDAFQQAIALYEQRQSPEADRLRKNLGEMGLI